MRNKEIRIIIQDRLLCFNGKFTSLISIKSLMHLRYDIIQRSIAVSTIILGSVRYNRTCEKILRITGRCRCKRTYIYVKITVLRISCMICCIVYIYLNSDVL